MPAAGGPRTFEGHRRECQVGSEVFRDEFRIESKPCAVRSLFPIALRLRWRAAAGTWNAALESPHEGAVDPSLDSRLRNANLVVAVILRTREELEIHTGIEVLQNFTVAGGIGFHRDGT